MNYTGSYILELKPNYMSLWTNMAFKITSD